MMLSDGRHRAADAMLKAATLGEFRYGPGDSPWYGANFDSSEQAMRAHGIAKQLHHTELPRLLERAGNSSTAPGCGRSSPSRSSASICGC